MTYHVEEADYPGGDKLWLGGRVQGDRRRETVGPPGRGESRHRQGRMGRENRSAADGRGAGYRRQRCVHRRRHGWFNAYDARNGKKLWSFQCGAGVNSPAVSYEVGGKQYIAVAAGGNNQLDFKRGTAFLCSRCVNLLPASAF